MYGQQYYYQNPYFVGPTVDQSCLQMPPEQSGLPESVQSNEGQQETVFDYYIPPPEMMTSPGHMTSSEGQESEQRGQINCSINPNTSSDSSSVDPNLYLKATNEKSEITERMSYDLNPGPSEINLPPGQHGGVLTDQIHLDDMQYGESRVNSFSPESHYVPVLAQNDFNRFQTNQNYCTFQY